MIRPLSDRIFIKPYENSELSHGGVYTGQAKTTFVPETDKCKQTTVGTVVAVGPGKDRRDGKRFPPQVNVGDVVCFSDTSSRPVVVDNEDLVYIRETDIAFFMDKETTVELVYRD